MTTTTRFQNLTDAVKKDPTYQEPAAFAAGLAYYAVDLKRGVVIPSSKVLHTWFPLVNVRENQGTAALLAHFTDYRNGSSTHLLSIPQLEEILQCFEPFQEDGKEHPNIDVLDELRSGAHSFPYFPNITVPQRAVVTFIGNLQEKPVDSHDANLRLHLLSHRKAKPHGLNLDGMIPMLPNVVWTNRGPFDPTTFNRVQLRLRTRGHSIHVYGVDKFPAMADCVVPSEVRIADASRVRMGAHLERGTTVMHEGFVNFNAGTVADEDETDFAAMVEGRISAGVRVGKSDIGGGASIMGTLSGGGKQVITIGNGTLLGANSGTGISLGDNCVVAAGLYITAGTLVKLPNGSVVKALELSGQDGLEFICHSQTGEVLVRPNKKSMRLNPILHVNV